MGSVEAVVVTVETGKADDALVGSVEAVVVTVDTGKTDYAKGGQC